MTLKERRFVNYYLGKANGNATLAARLAGYTSPGVLGHRLLKKVHIRDAIEAKLAPLEMDADEVLARISGLAASDMVDFLKFDADGDPTSEEIPSLDLRKARRREKLGCIRKLKKTTRRIPRGRDQEPEVETTVDVELHDPLKALTLLAKYHKLIDGGDRAEASVTVDVVEQAAARARARRERKPDAEQ